MLLIFVGKRDYVGVCVCMNLEWYEVGSNANLLLGIMLFCYEKAENKFSLSNEKLASFEEKAMKSSSLRLGFTAIELPTYSQP